MTVYHKDRESWATKQARVVEEHLTANGIESPDTSKMHQFKVKDTTFFFKTRAKLESFKKKYKKQLAKANKIEVEFFKRVDSEPLTDSVGGGGIPLSGLATNAI